MELIKPIVKVGNSAGVLLPREWLNGEAKVSLIKKPLNIKEDILSILSNYLQDIEAIALVGSYARNEQKSHSDIDVLAITSDKDMTIKSGKYEILLVSRKKLEDTLKSDALPLLPMIKEAKPIMNSIVIDNYKSANLTKLNLKWHFETTKSILNLVKKFIELAKVKSGRISPKISYTLILRLRQVIIVDALLKNKIAENKILLRLIKKLTGSLDIYRAYLSSKRNERSGKSVSIAEAERVYDYIKNSLEEQEKWIKRKS